jgi:Lar family restriction alleviation protein
MKPELKPCPFCDGTEMDVFLGVFDNPTYVLCKKCHAQGPAKEPESEQSAINAWNKRKVVDRKMEVGE